MRNEWKALWQCSEILLQKIYATGLFELVICNGDPWHAQIVLRLKNTEMLAKVNPANGKILWCDDTTRKFYSFNDLFDHVPENVREGFIFHLELFR